MSNSTTKKFSPVTLPPQTSKSSFWQLPTNDVQTQSSRFQAEEDTAGWQPRPNMGIENNLIMPLLQGSIQPKCETCADEEKEPQIQTKLTVGAPGDPYEQEADRVAAKVMAMSDHSPQVQRFEETKTPIQMWSEQRSITPVVQRQVDEQVQMRELVQRAFQGGGTQASGELESRLSGSKGGGSALAPEVRGFMEPRFGNDFSGVRVHTSNEAVKMNQELNAQAFAHKQDIYFGAGKSPGNDALTAHELTHVVQQTGKVDPKLGRHVNLMSPIIQRAGGWSDAKGGPNASESAVGGIRRIPIEGLALGNQTKASHPDSDESATGKAIILIPQALGQKPEPGQVEVLFHLHGFNSGYRKRTHQGNEGGMDKRAAAPGTVRDVTIDKIEQQLEASGRPQMMGILPQGANKSQFGASGLDIDKYISEVLVKIQPLTKWSKLPSTRVIMSAHSGGGGRIAELVSGTKGKLPASMGELILFDAINGPDELAKTQSWLLSQINLDMSNLTGKSQPDQLTYLESSLRFRGYYTPKYHPPKLDSNNKPLMANGKVVLDKSKFVGYGVRYELLNALLKKRFNRPDVKALLPAVASKLQDNYQVKPAGHSHHDAIVGGAKDSKGNPLGLADPLKDALSALQPKRLDSPGIQRQVAPATSQSLSPIRADEQRKALATFAHKAFTIFLPNGINPKSVTDVKVHVFFAAAGVQGGIANDVLVHGLRGASDSSPWILIAAPGVHGGAFLVSNNDINDCLNSIGISAAPSSLRLTGHSRGVDSLIASILRKKITTLSIIDHIFILDAAGGNKIPKLVSMGIPSTKVTAYQVNVHASKKTKGSTFIDLPSNCMAALGYIRLIQDAMLTQSGIAALVSSNPDISIQVSLLLPTRGSFTTGTPTGSQVSLQGFCKINSSTLQQIIKNDLNPKKGLLAFINKHDLAKFGTFKFSRGIAAHHFFVAEIAHELTQ